MTTTSSITGYHPSLSILVLFVYTQDELSELGSNFKEIIPGTVYHKKEN